MTRFVLPRTVHAFLAHVLLVPILMVIPKASLAWSSDPTINTVVSAIPGPQQNPAIASDGKGGAVVFWYNDPNPTDKGIYARHFDADGNPLTSPIKLGGVGQGQPLYIASDDVHGHWIGWVTGGKVVLQYLGPDDQLQWPLPPVGSGPIHVSSASDRENLTGLVPDGAGNVIAVWIDTDGTDYANSTNKGDIYAQKVSTNVVSSSLLWGSTGVLVSGGTSPQQEASVAADASHGAIIVWGDGDPGTGAENIYAQRLDATGNPQWPTPNTSADVPVCTAARNQAHPVLETDPSGGAWIAWQDARATGGTGWDIFARHVDQNGSLRTELTVCNANESQTEPSIVTDGSDGAILTWRDFRSVDHDIYVQRISGVDAMWGLNGFKICGHPGSQDHPSIVASGLASAMIAWEDMRSGDKDIYMQLIDEKDGSPNREWVDPEDGSYEGVPVSTAAGDQLSPVIAAVSPGNRAIVAWMDLRNAPDPGDIYFNKAPLDPTFWLLTGNSGTVDGTNFLGTLDNTPLDLRVDNQRTARFELTGLSPNVIEGSAVNAVRPLTNTETLDGATISGGGKPGGTIQSGLPPEPNLIEASFGSIGGGSGNSISPPGRNPSTSRPTYATIGGGHGNQITGASGTIGGGNENRLKGGHGVIGGGEYNEVGASDGVIGGGSGNSITPAGRVLPSYATVGGGRGNQVTAAFGTVGGGDRNSVSGGHSVIGGGESNEVSGSDATVPGGDHNVAGGAYSFAAGRQAQALHDGAFVWADNSSTAPWKSTSENQFLVRAAGGVGINTANPDPALALHIEGDFGRTDGPSEVSLWGSRIGDKGNGILYLRSGGSVVAIDKDNLGIGTDNPQLPLHIFSGGRRHLLMEAPGGQYCGLAMENEIGRWDMFTSGRVLAFTQGDPTSSSPVEQMLLMPPDVYVNGCLYEGSDRGSKTKVKTVAAADMLERLKQLPIREWSYKSQPTVRHIGPMAQDFREIFRVGKDDKHIATLDLAGVSIGAEQAIAAKVEAQEKQIDALERRIEELEKLVAKRTGGR